MSTEFVTWRTGRPNTRSAPVASARLTAVTTVARVTACSKNGRSWARNRPRSKSLPRRLVTDATPSCRATSVATYPARVAYTP